MRGGKLVVNGAKGYIGGRFIERYRDDYRITPVSLRANPAVDYSGVDTVLHLSALVHQPKARPQAEYFAINTRQTIDQAQRAKVAGVRHFVFFSTVAVYGRNGDLGEPEVLDEASECHPLDAYGKSKLAAERALLEMRSPEFEVAILRPPLVYGPGCPGNLQRMRKLVAAWPVLPFDLSDNRRSMVGIDNLLRFTRLVLDRELGGVLIPQDGELYSLRRTVERIAAQLNQPVRLIKPPRLLLAGLRLANPRLLRTLYGSLVFDSSESNRRTGYQADQVESGFF